MTLFSEKARPEALSLHLLKEKSLMITFAVTDKYRSHYDKTVKTCGPFFLQDNAFKALFYIRFKRSPQFTVYLRHGYTVVIFISSCVALPG